MHHHQPMYTRVFSEFLTFSKIQSTGHEVNEATSGSTVPRYILQLLFGEETHNC